MLAVALILLTRARCVKQAGAAYTVPIITYGTYQVKNGQGLNLEKVACIKGFRRFRALISRPFSMYKNRPHNVQVLPPMMYKDCPLNVQTLPPYNWISTAVYALPSLMALYPFIYRSFFQ